MLSWNVFASQGFKDGTESATSKKSTAKSESEGKNDENTRLSVEDPAFPEHDALNTVFLENEDDKFSLHNPTYFLLGKDDAKLQFSFKYRIFRKAPIHFGYTQRMYWKIYESSKPFNDLNYSPELFYRFKVYNEILKSIDIGYLHLSNGKDGPESRSMDQAYVSANLIKHTVDRVSYVFSIQGYYIFNKDITNRDIDNYMGFLKFNFTAMNVFHSDNNKFDFGLSAFPGKRSLPNGGYEINVRYAPAIREFNPAILLQYYQGHAESLIRYQYNESVLRLGVILYI